MSKILRLITIFALGLSTVALAASREIVHRTNPTYPEIAKRSNLQGTVTLRLTVGADGNVKAVTAVSGNAILSQAAILAVKQWVFAPGGEETFNVDVAFSYSGQ